MAFSFQTPQQPQPSLFQTPQQQQPSPFFQTPQPQQQQQQQSLFQLNTSSPSPFQFQPQQQQQQQQQQGQFQQQLVGGGGGQGGQQQLLLYTKDKAPAGYGTKFEDLHPDSQKILVLIEERIREYRDESERLEQCSRLYDLSAYGSFELDANRIIQELGIITTATEREKVSVQELMNNVKKMMWDADFSIRSYMMLRPRFLRLNSSTSNITSATQNAGAIVASGQGNQLSLSSAPTFDFYSGLPKRPSTFMQNTVARFEKYLSECCQWIAEVEQLLKADAEKTSSNCLEALPKVLTNVHDYFIHVAAKVESLHQYVESMKTSYLADQRRRGDGNDPFLEANRREAAKKEAAAKRVHPTLHLPAVSAQPITQVAGIFASSAAPVSTTTQQPVGSSAVTSSSGFSIFNSPSPAPSSSLFTTPAASAPSSLLSTPQSTTFGNPSTSLFVQTQGLPAISSTPSFGSTPAMGGSLFSTPPGALTGSGASFGPSKSSKPKARTSRR